MPRKPQPLPSLELRKQDHVPRIKQRELLSGTRENPLRTTYLKWFDAHDISNLRTSNQIIGDGFFGKVYAGKVKFKDGSVKRVAIKIFQEYIDRQIYDLATQYEQVIKEISEAGIPLPKMGLVKIKNPDPRKPGKYEVPVYDSKGNFAYSEIQRVYPDRYVLVSELFTNSSVDENGNLIRKTKLKDTTPEIFASQKGKKPNLFASLLGLENSDELKSLAQMWVKLLKNGFYPQGDCFQFLETKNGKIPILIDLDTIVDGKVRNAKPRDFTENIFFRDLNSIDQKMRRLTTSKQLEYTKRLRIFFSHLIPLLYKECPEIFGLLKYTLIYDNAIRKYLNTHTLGDYGL